MTATHEQLEMLLQFLQEHPQLAKGYTKGPDGRARSNHLWSDLTAQLNSLGGANKSVRQWQKVWADRKYLAKKAAAASRRSDSETNGSPAIAPVLTELEKKVVRLIGEGPVETPRQLAPRNPDSRRTHYRFRQPDVHTQLIRLEERKIAELAAIKQEMREFTGALREELGDLTGTLREVLAEIRRTPQHESII